MSQQDKRKNQMSESFFLKSGKAAIHDEVPFYTKMQYFDNLKEKDAAMKKIQSQVQRLKQRDVKDQHIARRMRNSKARAQTQMARGKRSSDHSQEQSIRLQVVPAASSTKEPEKSLKESDKNTQSLTFVNKESPNSKNQSRPASRNMLVEDGHTIQTKGFITEEGTDQGSTLAAAVQLPRKIAPPIHHNRRSTIDGLSPDIHQISLSKPRGRNRLKGDRQQVTSTTIGLPEKQLKEMEVQIYREASQTQIVVGSPRPQVSTQQATVPADSQTGGNLSQYVAEQLEPRTSNYGNAQLVNVETQASLLKEMGLKPQNSQVSFVPIKQQQIQNSELNEMGHEANRGFKSSITKRLSKQ